MKKMLLVATAALMAGGAMAQAIPAEGQAGVPAVAGDAQPAPAAAAPVTAEAGPVVNDPVPGVVKAPAAGNGQVVFFRKGGFVGSAISCAVHEGGARLSSLPPGRYFVLESAPGVREFAVKSESTDKLRLEVEDGETYFVQCGVSMGIMVGRPNLSPSDQAVFVSLAPKLKLVENKD